jgi:hypothetical protein
LASELPVKWIISIDCSLVFSTVEVFCERGGSDWFTVSFATFTCDNDRCRRDLFGTWRTTSCVEWCLLLADCMESIDQSELSELLTYWFLFDSLNICVTISFMRPMFFFRTINRFHSNDGNFWDVRTTLCHFEFRLKGVLFFQLFDFSLIWAAIEIFFIKTIRASHRSFNYFILFEFDYFHYNNVLNWLNAKLKKECEY